MYYSVQYIYLKWLKALSEFHGRVKLLHDFMYLSTTIKWKTVLFPTGIWNAEC